MDNTKEKKTKIHDIFSSEKNFARITSILSFLIAVLYFWKGYQEEFLPGTWAIIGINLIYIPFAFIFNRKGFPYFNLIYALVLVFILAFVKTYLYNNYSALFIIFVVIMILPKIQVQALLFYFLAISVAFAINEEAIYHYFIHITRAVWFFYIFNFVIEKKYERKKLILYDDEIQILDQLCNGKHYQKEVEGFSENTIYRKLKAARERNNCKTREELIELYRTEIENNKE